MRTIYKLLLVVLIGGGTLSSCNDEWTDEQFKQLISFKTQPGGWGVTDVHVRYANSAKYTYNLPVLVSGSTDNTDDRLVSFSLRDDTLDILNFEKFGNRPELYFRELPQKYYSFPKELTIPAGQSHALLPIEFSLDGLDDSQKWALPLKVCEDANGTYAVNPRKYYRTAVLRPILFNEFSGRFSGSSLLGTMAGESDIKFSSTEIKLNVVTDSIVFFYAGQRTEDYEDRINYKVFLQFTGDKVDSKKDLYKMKIWAENEKLSSFFILPLLIKCHRRWTHTKIYLKHTYIVISDIDFDFVDYTSVPNYEIEYNMKGGLSVSRDLDTRKPDEDQGSDSKWW